MAVYSPTCSGNRAIVAYAIAFGTTTAAAVRPAVMSGRSHAADTPEPREARYQRGRCHGDPQHNARWGVSPIWSAANSCAGEPAGPLKRLEN